MNPRFSKIRHEIKVRLLRFQTCIHENENTLQGFSVLQIPADHITPLIAHAPGNFGVSITREINEVKMIIDQEEI